jgi:hypothetical protein
MMSEPCPGSTVSRAGPMGSKTWRCGRRRGFECPADYLRLTDDDLDRDPYGAQIGAEQRRNI